MEDNQQQPQEESVFKFENKISTLEELGHTYSYDVKIKGIEDTIKQIISRLSAIHIEFNNSLDSMARIGHIIEKHERTLQDLAKEFRELKDRLQQSL